MAGPVYVKDMSRKTTVALILAVSFAAATVATQYLAVMGRDNFHLIEHDGQAYKLFTYGFPFRINDCNSVLAYKIHPPPQQTRVRIAGNFLFIAAAYLLAIQLGRKVLEKSRAKDMQR